MGNCKCLTKENKIGEAVLARPKDKRYYEEGSFSTQSAEIPFKNSIVRIVKESLPSFTSIEELLLDFRFEKMAEGFYKGERNEAGQRTGRGLFIFDNGSEYIGTWLEDEQSGHGRKIEMNGDYYEGEFLNGKFHGFGSYFNFHKLLFINGIWENGSILCIK